MFPYRGEGLAAFPLVVIVIYRINHVNFLYKLIKGGALFVKKKASCENEFYKHKDIFWRLPAILLIAVLLMAACGRNSTDSAKDDQNPSSTAKSRTCFFEEKENGFYFIPAMDEEYLYFFDEDAQSAVKVCGKANCGHRSEDCNARFGSSSMNTLNMYSLQNYHGKIYLWSASSMDGPHLYSADPDGTNHQDLGGLKIDTARGQGGVEASFISDDNVYVIAIVGTNNLGYQYMRFYKRSLEAGAEAQLIYADEDEKTVEHRMSQLTVEDGLVYFEDVAFFDGTNRLESRLYRYDPSKDELQNILTLENKQIIYTVKNQKIYYSAYNYAAEMSEAVCCYDPKTEENTVFLSTGGNVITWDQQYFVTEQYDFKNDAAASLSFFSEKGELIREVPADRLLNDPAESNICLSENYIVTDSYDFINSPVSQTIRIFKKEDILKGDYHYSELKFTMSYGN